ncbi:MAG: pentapeptide repeat-containing protein [Alphaproteobacteria bacterium]|nr:pentapeptide repeat-containing protein [Alphaproteobacteria bacterium]
MSNPKNSGQKGWLSRPWNRFKEWWLADLWWGVGLLVLIVWTHLSSEEPRSGVIAIFLLVVVIVVWYGQKTIEELKTCWRILALPVKRLVKWCGRSHWRVGWTVFFSVFAVWTLLALLVAPLLTRPLAWILSQFNVSLDTCQSRSACWGVYWDAYLQGLVLVILSGPTAGFTYWRGKQADEQTEETRNQIKATQRQGSYQTLNTILEMAVDVQDTMRAIAGWARLDLWFDADTSEGWEEPDTIKKYLGMARRTARSVLTLRRQAGILFDAELVGHRWLQDGSESWDAIRASYFEMSDRERIDEDVRQQAFEFLVKNSQRESGSVILLPKCDLSYLSLRESSLRIHANFSHCVNMSADFETSLSGSSFIHATMIGAELGHTTLHDVQFLQTDLRRAHLSGADLRGAVLYGANLRMADLHGSILVRAYLVEADLTAADLREAELAGGWLEGQLDFVHFHKTRINGADFTDIPEVPTRVLKALLQGCWWERGGGDGAPPSLPEGIIADDIPGAPEETVATGGRGWEPPEDD